MEYDTIAYTPLKSSSIEPNSLQLLDNCLNVTIINREVSIDIDTDSIKSDIPESLNFDIEKEPFYYIEDENKRLMISTCWQAINELNLWEFMKEEKKSYLFCNDKEIHLIMDKIIELGFHEHSGNSYEWTLRQLQYIAIHGEEQYKEDILLYKNLKVNY
jgi:hypothetical protein